MLFRVFHRRLLEQPDDRELDARFRLPLEQVQDDRHGGSRRTEQKQR